MSNVAASAGIIAREEQAAIEAIRSGLQAAGIEPGTRPIDLRALPFEGTWGSASTVSRLFAGELVNADLAASGELAGLSKKEARQKVNDLVGPRAQALAEQVVAHIAASGRFATVEAVNGYINLTYDANQVARSLLAEVLGQGDFYGHAPAGSQAERVMIEHSQLNTHKAAHVGHLRNICLGVAVTNISTAAGYETLPVNYIGDIGRHVIRCLWCYQTFHLGEEPQGDASRGRWLGDIYAEADQRLNFRTDAMKFLNALVQEDLAFATAADHMMRLLWRTNTADGEDIAYLLGRISAQQEIDLAELRDQNVIVAFWPIIGTQLGEELERVEPEVEIDEEVDLETASAVTPTMSIEERIAGWQALDARMASWWPQVPSWNEATRDLFQKWETKDPEFVALWRQTRDWSMADLYNIFDEFGAPFSHYFWESEVEEPGRQIVRELLERGIAEVSDGLPVVKID
ncbi:MAG TPA: arginine--tRNA ligase, partial [Thermomicrobiales bacterium]|nr:arginine--tRNA ligase [Thermomicrobiales bacterium]